MDVSAAVTWGCSACMAGLASSASWQRAAEERQLGE